MQEELSVDHLYFRLGFAPNAQEMTQLLNESCIGSLKLTPFGYIEIDAFLRTSIPTIYAAGDVVNFRDPCVATAVAQGAIAARSVSEDLQY